MRAFQRLIRSRRGISMVETIVAMALVLVVTGAAMSVFISSATADVKFRDKTAALSACDSAADCVRFADGDSVILAEALEKIGFKEYVEASEWRFVSGDETVLVRLDNDKCVVKYDDKIIYEYDIETPQSDS